MMLARKNHHGDGDTDQATMERHTALPNTQDHTGISEPFIGTVEKHVTKSAAENHPPGTVDNDVFHLSFFDWRPGALTVAHRQHPSQAKAEQIHNAIPVNLKRSKDSIAQAKRPHGECDRIYSWII